MTKPWRGSSYHGWAVSQSLPGSAAHVEPLDACWQRQNKEQQMKLCSTYSSPEGYSCPARELTLNCFILVKYCPIWPVVSPPGAACPPTACPPTPAFSKIDRPEKCPKNVQKRTASNETILRQHVRVPRSKRPGVRPRHDGSAAGRFPVGSRPGRRLVQIRQTRGGLPLARTERPRTFRQHVGAVASFEFARGNPVLFGAPAGQRPGTAPGFFQAGGAFAVPISRRQREPGPRDLEHLDIGSQRGRCRR